MQMRGTESGKTEASDRKSAGEKERDGQMNRGEERGRQTDKSNRHLQPHGRYKEVLHLRVRDTDCVSVLGRWR